MLASSQSEIERQRLREEMSADPTLGRLLRQLETVKGEEEGGGDDNLSAPRGPRRKDVAEDMSTGPAGDGGNVSGIRQVLDLEDLVFAQGSHFMSNKRCQLPDGSFRKQRKGNP